VVKTIDWQPSINDKPRKGIIIIAPGVNPGFAIPPIYSGASSCLTIKYQDSMHREKRQVAIRLQAAVPSLQTNIKLQRSESLVEIQSYKE
jgi:hypothetical protein